MDKSEENARYRKLYEETGTIDIQWLKNSISFMRDKDSPKTMSDEKMQELLEIYSEKARQQMYDSLKRMEDEENG